jgi:hypothetical protein
VAYVAVASAIALQLSGTIHLAIVQHAICAEHGEAMDVGEDEDAHGHHVAPAARQTLESVQSLISASTSPSSRDESHHHCPLDEDRNTHALVVYAASISPHSASSIELALPPAEPVRPSARELHRLAPKTSPPV